MIYVALAAIAAATVVSVVLGNLLRIQTRAHTRERDRLIEQVCHLSGRPWTIAPAEDTWEPPEEKRELVHSPERYVDDF